MSSTTLKIDAGVVSKFLHILDPMAEYFTFQTFDDTSKKSELAKIIHSNLDNALPQLDTLQANGAGIFVTVNETDGNGRKTENIIRVRAIIADCDGIDHLPMTNLLPPHLLIESSPGRYHAYWLVSDCELNQFKSVQQAIATKYGTDKTVCDLPRVMRLPGAWHQKGEPVQAKILEIIEREPYHLQDIIDGLNLTLATPVSNNKSFGANNRHFLPPSVDKVESSLKALPDWFFDDYGSWRDVLFAIHSAFNGSDEGFQIIDDWSKQSAKYGGTRKLWDSIKDATDNGITIGSLFYWARQNGWVWTQYAKTDLGNADRFVDQFGNQIRYLSQRKAWLLWNGSHWDVDTTNKVKDFATQTVRNIYKEVAAINDDTERAALAKWAKASQAAPRIAAMLELAKCNQTIATGLDELDCNPWLFNCANGTINLKTGDFYEAKPSDLITKSSPVIYDPNANCPIWLKFLDRVLDHDVELIKFVQRAIGYSLTGVIDDEALFFLYGSGANGKSIFLETIINMMGGYTIRLGLESLLKKRNGEGIPNDIARLKGVRFCAASEIDQDGRFNESKLKDLASRDTITARFLHGEFFDFRQSHKLWMFGNHRPFIHGNDDGIWRRIKLIPFKVTIPDDEKDYHLDEKLLGELSGIFNWALEGCKQWQAMGLAVPDSVTKATGDYRDEMDILGNFINEKCDVDQNAVVKAGILQTAYKSWCDENGHKPLSSSSLRQQLGSKGVKHHRKSSGAEYQGLAFKPLPVVTIASLLGNHP